MFCLARPILAQSIPQQESGQRLKARITRLVSPEFAGRAFKSEGGRKAADFIAAQFRDAGLKPVTGATYLQPITGGGQNVIGLIEGKQHQDEFILVGAHYDGFGGAFPGAMDNAAGVAAMIEAAMLLAKNPPARSVLFIAFDGGEQNNAGARFYSGRPLVAMEKTLAAVSLAGFGGGFGEQLLDSLYIFGSEVSQQISQSITKHKLGTSHLALLGGDTPSFIGAEHYKFAMQQIPAITITNGLHYAYHTKADTANRINFPALEKLIPTLADVIAEIANISGGIERQAVPAYDADEASEWLRLLTALRENVIKTSANNAGLAQVDDVLMELKRFKGRAVTDPKAREAVILRAASICFYIANPNGVEYNSLHSAARRSEQRGDRRQAIAAYQKLLQYIETEYRRDDQTVNNIRERLKTLSAK